MLQKLRPEQKWSRIRSWKSWRRFWAVWTVKVSINVWSPQFILVSKTCLFLPFFFSSVRFAGDDFDCDGEGGERSDAIGWRDLLEVLPACDGYSPQHEQQDAFGGRLWRHLWKTNTKVRFCKRTYNTFNLVRFLFVWPFLGCQVDVSDGAAQAVRSSLS